MSDINQIIQVTTTRQTPVASLPGFGVPGILAQFATSKTTTAFTRARYYASTSEMTADGWAATDSVYQAAAAIFSQNPRVPRVFVGRIDSGDASAAASGDAIRAEQDDWYTFEVVGNRSVKFVLSADLITGNVLSSSINGTTVSPVTYATSHANTMSLWKTAIESAITGATATISGREMTVTQVGKDMNIATASVASGASQPTIAITYPLDATKTKAWMAWGATQKKLQFVQDSDAATYAADTNNTGTACLAEFAKLSSYDRVAVIYHATNTEYAAAAWVGKELPYDPGLRTWAFKHLTGVSADVLTSSQEALVRGKNANVYTTTASYAHTYEGRCAKASTFIDDVRGLDWLDTTIKTDLFNLLATSGKVPMTDAGIQTVGGTLKASLALAEARSVLASGWTVSVPLASEVPDADKALRKLTGITWTGTLAGAVHSIVINGTVSV